MKEWQTFVRRFSDMKEGVREIFIKDLTEGKRKYDTKHVIAAVSRTKVGMKEPDVLWVRAESGEKLPDPWYIAISKELPDYVSGRPWDDLLEILAKRKAED